uniref:Polyprotein protein n=1 Tax=Solanum tuberosum TaxID=4113 RepID=M1DFY4_SOLTU
MSSLIALSAPLTPKYTVTFGRLFCARRMVSVICRKAISIVDMPFSGKVLSQSFRRARSGSPVIQRLADRFIEVAHSKEEAQLGIIIEQEMAMRAKQRHTSLPFLVLIIKFCRRAGVPRGEKRDVEVTSTSTTNIRHIEAEYTQEEADMRRAALVDASQEVDVDSIPAEASFSSLTYGLSDGALSPFYDCEGYPVGDQADDVDALAFSEISPSTTKAVYVDDVAADESEAETDEEQIEVQDETIYGDLHDLEETIVQSVIQISLTEMSMAGPSGSSVVDATPGSDAPTNGATNCFLFVVG